MITEIRRQFREIDGLLEGKEGVEPDSATCVDISTQEFALREMVMRTSGNFQSCDYWTSTGILPLLAAHWPVLQLLEFCWHYSCQCRRSLGQCKEGY